jgi:hypothetical protein
VDEHLKLLADAGLDVGAAEDALDAGDTGPAREALEHAQAALADLRARWPAMTAAERRVIGATAGTVRARLDAALARLPRRQALSIGGTEHDAEEDVDPAAA